MKTLFKPALVFALGIGLLSSPILAQEKNTHTKTIDVSIEDGKKTVTIVTDDNGEKTVRTYTGKEAEEILEKEHRLMPPRANREIMDVDVTEENGETTVNITLGDGKDNKTIVLTGDKATRFLERRHHLEKLQQLHSFDKDIEVIEENGEKIVRITTRKNGDEDVKELRGEEAEAFLKRKHERMVRHHRKPLKGQFKHIEIDVEEDNGTTTLTITKTNDEGDEEVKVLTGEEAKEFLKNHKQHGAKHKKIVSEFVFEDDEGSEQINIIRERGLKLIIKNKHDVLVWSEDQEISDDEVNALLKKHGFDPTQLTIKSCETKRDCDVAKLHLRHLKKNRMHHPFLWDEYLDSDVHVIIEDMDAYAPKMAKSKTLALDDLQFFPNPNKGKFKVSFTNPKSQALTISIKDISGRLIYETTVDNEGKVIQDIDISDQGAGVYIISLSQGNKLLSKKLLVE